MICYKLLHVSHDLPVSSVRLLLRHLEAEVAGGGRLRVEDEWDGQEAFDELDKGIAAMGLLMTRRDIQHWMMATKRAIGSPGVLAFRAYSTRYLVRKLVSV